MIKQYGLGLGLVGFIIIVLAAILATAEIAPSGVVLSMLAVGLMLLGTLLVSRKQEAKSEQNLPTTSAVRPLKVFLCHSSGDKPIVRKLYKKLSAEGWIDVWLDEEKLIPGQNWDYEIEKALDNSDAVIVTLSTGSVSKEGYVQKEFKFVLDIALEKPEGTIYILPVRLDDCERPRRLRSIQGIDYFPPEQHEWAYARLRSSLEQRAKSLGIIAEPK